MIIKTFIITMDPKDSVDRPYPTVHGRESNSRPVDHKSDAQPLHHANHPRRCWGGGRPYAPFTGKPEQERSTNWSGI